MTYNNGWEYLRDENFKKERMIHLYQDEIEKLEVENEHLLQTVLILESRLKYYESVVKEEADKGVVTVQSNLSFFIVRK